LIVSEPDAERTGGSSESPIVQEITDDIGNTLSNLLNNLFD
jgi:hypothetical protein